MRSNNPVPHRYTTLLTLLTFYGAMVCCLPARAQENEFIPNTENATLLASLLDQYQLQHKNELDQLPSTNRKDYVEPMGSFDYAFTTGDADNSNFAVCYNDYERSSEYHGQTFNAIKYNGRKFTTDKIELKSKASMMHVFPAKGGSIMIMEYYKKDKRLDFRLEKLG